MTDTAWAPAACTLPTVERPLREREFDNLFRNSLRTAQLVDTTRADFVLAPDSEDRARDLAARETSCCSFFSFDFASDPEALTMTITVPAEHEAVLASLVESATLSIAGGSK